MTDSSDPLLLTLRGAPAPDWLGEAQRLALEHRAAAAARLLGQAILEHPESADLIYALAGLSADAGQVEQAQTLLRQVLDLSPAHLGAAMMRARLLIGEGKTAAAARVLQPQIDRVAMEPEQVIQIVELLDDVGRKRDASQWCEAAIEATPEDVRLHAYAAMLAAQLGGFDLARQRYLYVATHSEQAPDWHVPLGLAALQRYRDPQHPDIALFERYLQKPLRDPARASVLFALGKARDDLGDTQTAAECFREANALAHAAQPWSRKHWQRSVEMRRHRRLLATAAPVPDAWTPVFIVGLPRSGSTLLAERLARHPQVFHRGESPWLPTVAKSINAQAADYSAQLERARATYAAQLRQDDNDARWIIDKQPSNVLDVDLILAMFPHARIIHCRRQPRDNALSIWMQSFLSPSQAFAYDWADIAAVSRGTVQLMQHWQERFPDSVRAVPYEALVENTAATLAELAEWLALPAVTSPDTVASQAISTASLWQARQPVHTRSIGRWRAYAPYLPELLRLPERSHE